MLALILLVVASTALLFAALLEKSNAWVPVAVFWFLLGSYAAGNPLIFDWYLPTFFGLTLLILLAGFHTVGRALNKWSRTLPRIKLGCEGGAFASVSFIVIWLTATSVVRYIGSPWGLRTPIESAALDPTRLRVLAYRRAAEKMNTLPEAGGLIGASEIGAFGYYSGARIIDFCGLVSPEVHPFLPVPPEERLGPDMGAIGTAMVRASLPNYIVTMPAFSGLSLGRSDWFADSYYLFDRVPLPAVCWGSKDVLIYRKRI